MNSPHVNRFIPALIIAGFAGMMSQIVLLREIVIIFLGNELTLGIMLGIWLFGTALGSGAFVAWIQKVRRPVALFAWLQMLMAVILPMTLSFIRLSPSLWGFNRGELIGLLPLLLLPLTVLIPICLVIGFLYTLGSYIYNQMTRERSAAASKVYLFESIGAGAASLIVSIVLLRFMENFELAIVIGVVNLISAMILLRLETNRNQVIGFGLILLIILTSPSLDRISNRQLWRPMELLHDESTMYGNIAITRFGDSISFYENGVLMFTHPDLLYTEESVHFALLEHPAPKDVLLIGGGVGGGMTEILRHPDVRHVDYVELDPRIIQLSRTYLPEEMTSVLSDPRVFIREGDGRRFLKTTNHTYDVIIVNLPDPETTMINRFYTVEFFRQARQILSENGVISFSITSSVNVIGEELADLLSCLYHTLSSVFPDVIIIPGDTNHFLGCLRKDVLTRDPSLLVERSEDRGLQLNYVNQYYVPYRMSGDRMDYLRQRVIDRPSPELNRDFKPIGNFFHLLLWTTYFDQHLKNIFLFFDRLGFFGVMCFAWLIFLPFMFRFFVKGGREKNYTGGILISVMVLGFAGIALEVVIILGFQAIYGYVYFQISLILSSFMIGLAGGSFLAIRMMRKMKNVFYVFRWIQLLMAIYPFVTIFVLYRISILSSLGFLIQLLFSLLTISVGLIVGYQYPLACRLYSDLFPRVERVAGRIYAADLIGACAGALLTSALLIPLLGLTATCSAIGVINLAVLAGLMLAKKND